MLWCTIDNNFFLSNFIISAEMASFSFVDKGYVNLLNIYLENSFSSSFSPLLIISRIYESLVYLCQFLLKYLRLPPWTFYTSWCSSFTIWSLNPGGPSIFNFYFIFGVCCCCCGCCCKTSGTDRLYSFGTHSECNSQGFKRIDASFLTFSKSCFMS